LGASRLVCPEITFQLPIALNSLNIAELLDF